MPTTLMETIIEEIERLPVDRQPDALRAVQALGRGRRAGVPGSALLPSFGVLSEEDANAMERAIEEEFERVDVNDW